jgi:hypothetical protein
MVLKEGKCAAEYLVKTLIIWRCYTPVRCAHPVFLGIEGNSKKIPLFGKIRAPIKSVSQRKT